MYMLLLSQMICRHGLSFHSYTDNAFKDLSKYKVHHSTSSHLYNWMYSWLHDMKSWIGSNPGKTEILLVAPNTFSFKTTVDGLSVKPFYKSRYNSCTSHLQSTTMPLELLQPCIPVWSHRSTNTSLLVVPKTRLTSVEGRLFRGVASKLWNDIPQGLRDCTSFSHFKCCLNRFFFPNTFPFLHPNVFLFVNI